MQNKPKIAIIGASYLQLPLVLKANELGYETFCFAYLEGAVCKDHCTAFYDISIVEKEAILSVCTELKIDAILTISSDLAVPTVNYVGNKLGLVCNPTASTEITTDKFQMKKAFASNGICSAQFIQCNSHTDLSAVKNLRYPLIVKPVDRSGSIGVTKVEHESLLVAAFDKALSNSLKKEVIVEEFITGTEVSVETISSNNVHSILAITDKVTTGAPHFVELEHHQPSLLSSTLQQSIRTLVISALNALKIQVGASHAELIISNDGTIYVNEVGARMGGDFIGSDLVQLSTGFDYLKAVLHLSLGIPVAIETEMRGHAGVIFEHSENIHAFERISEQEEFVVRLEKNKTSGKTLEKSSDRGNYLIYRNEKRINLAEL